MTNSQSIHIGYKYITTYTYIYTYLHIHIYIQTHTYTSTYINTYLDMHIHIHITRPITRLSPCALIYTRTHDAELEPMLAQTVFLFVRVGSIRKGLDL